MDRRRYKFIGLMLALFLFGQSLFPIAGMAEISMRCAGLPNASPCAHMVVPLTDAHSVSQHLSTLPCCRKMLGCGSMMMGGVRMHAAASLVGSHPEIGSPATCVVTVTPMVATRTTAVFQTRRWMLASPPALAPPSIESLPVTPVASSASYLFPVGKGHFPRPLISSHGLRAPPSI